MQENQVMFHDWKTKIRDNPQISPHLLWDVDKTKIDYQKMKLFIVERVIERGDILFNLKKTEMECYKRRQLRKKHLGF